MPLTKRLSAEFIGTLWLVLGGCGSAVLATSYPNLGIGFAGVSLAFGLTVLTMAYAIGHISGCHLNPAVTVGLWAGKRFPAGEILPYVIAQVLGAIAGAGIDVYDVEPLPVAHPLRGLPNTVLTPHLGYVTEDNYRILYRETVEDIRAWLDGKPIRLLTAGK